MSVHVLVLYASTHGHTAKIAERVGAVLREQGVDARVREVGIGAEIDLSEYDGTIVGASVHAGHHQREIVAWATARHQELNARPSAFFSVSLTAADDNEKAHATTAAMIDGVLTASGWRPMSTQAMAGALQFREYNLPVRLLMRLIGRRHGRRGQGRKDVDHTDWAEVERFARRFALLVQPSEVRS